MKLSRLKMNLGSTLLNIPGWRTKRKLVIFESDDWGSIRMPSPEVYSTMLKQELIHPDYAFAKYDSLASESDLTHIFEVLTSVKDNAGNYPVFTANCVVANPDFERIEASNFNTYYYEPFTTTLDRYPAHKNSFNIWLQGIKSGVFYPQYHGREHINVSRWMKQLKDGNEDLLAAFKLKTFLIKPYLKNHKLTNTAAALDMDNHHDAIKLKEILAEGYQLFESIFGYKSISFIAPNYIWDSSIEPDLAQLGIKYLQGSKYQNIPIQNKETYIRKFRFTGQKNNFGQLSLVRNCYFEPSLARAPDLVDVCLKSISNAFFWGKPAIISTHRLNYIGFINSQNRDRNLPMLKNLLQQIKNKWPDVEFITSHQLGEIIVNAQ